VPAPALSALRGANARTAKYVRGMYAARVRGRVPEDVEDALESRGIKYRPRDQTEQD
jgi:transcription elongation factor SPT4